MSVAPFVIAMKFTSDASGVKASTSQVREELRALGADIERSAGKAAQLQRLWTSGAGGTWQVRDDFGSSARAADIEAYGRELDELRARYNPVFAAEQRHKANLAEINRAYRLGAISNRELSAALRAEEAAFARSTAAIRTNAEALQQRQVNAVAANDNSFATANIAAQFQDVAVTSAMGMSPLQIALQQGTQISAAFGNMGAAGAVKTAASAFMSIVSPVSLMTIALVGGTAAAIQFFSGLRKEEKTAAEALEEHKERLEELLAGYDEARAAGQQLLAGRERAPEAAVLSDLGAFKEDAAKRYLDLLGKVTVKQREFQDVIDLSVQAVGADEASAMMQRVLDIVTEAGLSADTSSAQFDALVTSLTLIKNTSADDDVVYIAESLLELINNAAQGRDNIDSLDASLRALPRDVRIRVTLATNMAGKFSDAMEELEGLVPDSRDRTVIMREQNEAFYNQAVKNAQSIGATSAAYERYQANLQGIIAIEDEAASRASARSAKQVSAYESAIAAVRDRVAAAELESNVIGLGTFATERARVALELETAAKKDAIGLTPTRIAQIQQEATAQALVTAKLEEQRRVQQANEEQMNFNRSTLTGFLQDLRSGLADGAIGWHVLGNAAANALDRIASRATDMLGNGIFDLIMGAFTGAIGGGFGTIGAGGVGIPSGGFIPGITGPRLFSTGGWTGSGNPADLAGGVHKEEFVVRAGPAAQHRQLLETINAGGMPAMGGVTLAPHYNFNGSGFTEAQARRLMQDNNRELVRQIPLVMADAYNRAARGTG